MLSVEMNMTDIGFSKLGVDVDGYDIMTLLDDYAIFEARDMTATLTGGYSMITDPAILGDFGMFTFDLGNQTLVFGSHAEVTDDGHLQIDLRKFEVLSTDMKMGFDGIADLPDIMARFISYCGNTIRSRLVSIVAYLGPSGWQTGINKILSLIPDEIDIPFTNMTLEGGLAKGLTVVKGDYASIPMDVSLQMKHKRLNATNIANFDNVTRDGYQMCGCMTDYIMNSFVDPVFELGLLKYNATIPLITTTWINAGLIMEGGVSCIYFILFPY